MRLQSPEGGGVRQCGGQAHKHTKTHTHRNTHNRPGAVTVPKSFGQ